MAKIEKKFKFWKTEIAESAKNAEKDSSTVDKITIFKKGMALKVCNVYNNYLTEGMTQFQAVWFSRSQVMGIWISKSENNVKKGKC